MNNKTKGVIAGIAGIALLGGGTTFALWSADADVNGGTITNGDLDVTAGALTWQDVSSDRAPGHPHAIDLATWRMVPGDEARGTVQLDVVLVGDNLVANLGVNTTGVTDLPDGVSVKYEVLDSTNASVGAGELGESSELRLSASGTYTVQIDVAFDVVDDDADRVITGRDEVNATTVLEDIQVTLEQVRSGDGFTP